jgi:predicted aspartyl protease
MRSVECGLPVGGPDERVAWLVRNGPTLATRIGFDQGYRIADRVPPNLPEGEHAALVDTGAQLSCIDSALAADLNLPIVDREPVSGAHGSHEVNVHLAQIYVPALEMTIVGRFHGVHLTAGNQKHLALLGRTFLQRCTMSYDGPAGTVTISRA